ncbi:MAG: hypothetical protein ACE5I1_21450 [bacterium]
MSTQKPENKTSRLPQSLAPLFWEYDFDALSWQSDADLITLRILTSGDWQTVTWLRQQIGNEGLRRWLLTRKGRGLDPRRLRFWELILDLPNEQVNEWIDLLEQDPWHRRNVQ